MRGVNPDLGEREGGVRHDAATLGQYEARALRVLGHQLLEDGVAQPEIDVAAVTARRGGVTQQDVAAVSGGVTLRGVMGKDVTVTEVAASGRWGCGCSGAEGKKGGESATRRSSTWRYAEGEPADKKRGEAAGCVLATVRVVALLPSHASTCKTHRRHSRFSGAGGTFEIARS